MKRKSELYAMVNEIVGMDISFILDDIIGHFAEPDIPINIDHDDFEIDIDTPYGNMHLSLITSTNGINQELILKRIVSNTFCEEYKINLNRYDEEFLCLDGKTIELRPKCFIINYIEKDYNSSNLTGNSEKNREIYENGDIVVDGIDSVIKVQEVYANKTLKKLYGREAIDDPTHEEIFKYLGSIKSDISFISSLPEYITSLYMHLPSEGLTHTNTTFIKTTVNGYDHSNLYPMITGVNAVGRAFKLYQGIVDQDNYKDAIRLINSGNFNMSFAYEEYDDGNSSISKTIEDIAGAPTVSHQREYTAEVRDIVNKYYNHVKHNPFLFDDYSKSQTDKKRELEKNKYIKQILLSNRDNM